MQAEIPLGTILPHSSGQASSCGHRGRRVADSGNLSARCPAGTISLTAAGVREDVPTPHDLVRFEMERLGNVARSLLVARLLGER